MNLTCWSDQPLKDLESRITLARSHLHTSSTTQRLVKAAGFGGLSTVTQPTMLMCTDCRRMVISRSVRLASTTVLNTPSTHLSATF